MTMQEMRGITVRCPTCGAKPGERCELTTGQPRTQAHVDRRLAEGKRREPVVAEDEMDASPDVPPVVTPAA